MSGLEMEIDRERNEEDLLLQSNSVEDAPSCSSSILNTPKKTGVAMEDEYADDDDYEDGINVTLLSTPPSNQLPPTGTEQTKTPSNGNSKKRQGKLSGAGLKRFKKLRESGYSRQEAHQLAQIPHRTTDLSKRPRNSDLNGSNSSGNPRPPKLPRQTGNARSTANRSVQQRIEAIRAQGVQPSYKDVVTGVKLGILPVGYPNIELTTQQLNDTQNAVISKVTEQRKEALKPKFGHCAFKSGYLVILCKNQETAGWLKSVVSSIKPWPGAELFAVDEKDIPRPEILIGFFPLSVADTTDRILALLESQNDGLVVDAWRILQRNAINQHVELVFTVDGVSMNSIKKSKFVLDYKFGSAQLRQKLKKKVQVDTTELNVQNNLSSGGSELTGGPIIVKTHKDTGDAGTNINVQSQIPGPSGVNEMRRNLEQTDRTTQNANYRRIKLQSSDNPNTGNRMSNSGKQRPPQRCGDPSRRNE